MFGLRVRIEAAQCTMKGQQAHRITGLASKSWIPLRVSATRPGASS